MILTKVLADQLRAGHFRDMITAARIVEVRANQWAPPDCIYALNALDDWGFMTVDETRGKVIVVCAPYLRETAEEMVRMLRDSTWTKPAPPREPK